MIDNYNRSINYLRISVTDRCNLRCKYCMPQEGIKLLDHSQIITFDQIREFTQAAIACGINKIRLTGGEPLVRKDIVKLVKMISSLNGVIDLSMTTNGTLLSKFSKDLKDAGLMRVNISLDTTDPSEYREITRGGEISEVIEGIKSAIESNLSPVKINCVVKESRQEANAIKVAKLGEKLGCIVRFIPQMNLETGHFGIVDGGTGGNCKLCNRIRLTSNGRVHPCLFSDSYIEISKYGNSIEGYIKAIKETILIKPSKGENNHTDKFYNIGG